MEKYVVTKLKSSEITKKTKVIEPKNLEGSKKTTRANARSPRKPVLARAAVQDAAYTQAHAETAHDRQSAAMKQRITHMVARGKDLVSGDATSVATVAAIVVGAALIEVELIPGLVIGAGAVLLGKLFPELGDYVRPAIKGALRTGFFMAHKVREVMAETSDQVHDLVAEVVLEQKQPVASTRTHADPKTDHSLVPKV